MVDDIIITAAVISSLLPPQAVWLEPFIGAIAGIISLHVPTLCASDPEPDPGLSGPDILSLVALGPGPLTADAYARFQQLVRRYAWFTFCRCSGGSTPAEPAFPSAPTDLPALNPPGLVGVGSGPCGTVSYSGTVTAANDPIDMRTGVQVDVTGQPTSLSLAVAIPPGATAYQYSYSCSSPTVTDSNAAHFYGVELLLWDGSGGHAFGVVDRLAAGSSADTINQSWVGDVHPIPAGRVSYTLKGLAATTPAPMAMDTSLSFFCGTAPTPITGVATCCSASDPYTTGQLTQILQMVTLVQRSLAPFAYVGGASHTGLTGVGVLTIPSLQGIKVTLTTQPTYIGEEFGDPLELFDAGWFAWGTTDGFLSRELLSHNPQLSFPAKAEQYTRLGYTLNPGVVATVQELYAET